MLEHIKHRLNEEEIRELIGYSVFPDPDRIEQAVARYQQEDQLQLYGAVEEDEVIGIVGFSMDEDQNLILQHIAVRPENREQGYGRSIMLELIGLTNPKSIVSETDESAADFYRNIGFTVFSLGEKYPGVERFRCEYITEED
ncbi:GNAT family N-acetyltransferase [Paenibacillus terrigena]|uniref:GNAT family N-acetyltransferase n=1 Tax=Paenibacillus terrigena TaxID=369333 RepID=UPI000367435A|nr:GNAT family N-acetyltransferase [Paenibacillus terrigena]